MTDDRDHAATGLRLTQGEANRAMWSELDRRRQQIRRLRDLYFAAVTHPGVVIEAKGDDAARAWNALAQEMEALTRG